MRGEKLAGWMPAVRVHVTQRGLQTPPSCCLGMTGISEVQVEWGIKATVPSPRRVEHPQILGWQLSRPETQNPGHCPQEDLGLRQPHLLASRVGHSVPVLLTQGKCP